jgi:hypothetical protein
MKYVGTTESREDATNGNTEKLRGNSVERIITVNFHFLSAVSFHFDMDMSYTRVLHIKVAYRVPHK